MSFLPVSKVWFPLTCLCAIRHVGKLRGAAVFHRNLLVWSPGLNSTIKVLPYRRPSLAPA